MFRRNVAAAKITAGLAGMVLAGVTLTAGVSPDSGPGHHGGPPPSTEAPAASLEGMKILMTNDDSMQALRENNSDGLGLYEMRKALCEAGADVVVVAPWTVQSGRGTAVTNSGTMTPAEAPGIRDEYATDCDGAPSGGAVFGLCLEDGPCTADSVSATPSDTVKFSMRGGLDALVGWSEGPDLVVSGPNSGLNVASSVTDSGTIGAAVASLESHVPVVAFSTAGYDDNSGFPQENYAATSQWAAQFLEGLASEGLLDQAEFAVSVNYPNISEGRPAGEAQYVEVGTGTFAYHTYTARGDGTYEIEIERCEGTELCPETKNPADWQVAYQQNHIGVTAIGVDRSYGTEVRGQEDLERLKSYVAEGAPAPIS